MSLINDALKKAARQRAEEQGDVLPPMPGGGSRRITRQGAPMRTQTIVLIAAAAIALVVVSVVVTGVLINGKGDAKAVAPAQVAVVAKAPPIPAAVVIQVAAPPKPTPVPTLPPTPTPVPPAVAVAEVAAATPGTAPVATPTPAPTAIPLTHAERVQAFIDNLHISGVRASGTDSKALVDGHVYKINDILDRALGIKLVKIDADSLTLVDSDGKTFVKTF